MELTEHEKFNIMSDEEKNAIQQFCEYLEEQRYYLKTIDINEETKQPFEKTIKFSEAYYGFFGINEKQLEKERQYILEKQRSI